MEGRDWVLLKSRWRSSLYLILIGNEIQAKEGEKPTMFSLLRVSIGERKGAASQILRHRFFIGMSIFFSGWILVPAFKKKKVFTHGSHFYVSVPLATLPVFPMQLIPRTRRAQSCAPQNQELSRSPLVNPFEVSHEVIFNSRGPFGFLKEWGILEERRVIEKLYFKPEFEGPERYRWNCGETLVGDGGTVRKRLPLPGCAAPWTGAYKKITKPSLLAS